MVSVAIRFFTGQVLTRDQPVILPEKESQLLFTVAAAEHTIHIEKVIDQIWPDADGDAGHNCFRVCLCRLHKHLAAGAIIIHKSQHYCVRADVEIDLRALRQTLALPSHTVLDLRPFYERIFDGQMARRSLGDWFHPFEDLLIRYFLKFGYLLCDMALKNHDHSQAATYARQILDVSPEDTVARETLLRCNTPVMLLTR